MFASVLVDVSLDRDNKVFTYAIPDGLTVEVGARVSVPFGPREIEGFVTEISNATTQDISKIKPIKKVMDDFVPIKVETLAILSQICDKFKLRAIDVLRLFVPASLRGRVRKRRAKNVEIRGLDIQQKKITLTNQQSSVINKITAPSAQIFVLHGVTGSGKTEVYMNVIETMLARGKTAIMLVPEIGLTPQVLGNFRARFGDKVAILHSGLTTGERYDEWYRLHTGEARIAVGARSAIFAPIENIGVIIIDEEHDTSYFSESNPRFYTHEIAKIRCRYWDADLVLGSATPSVDTYHRAKSGEYTLLQLDRRVGNVNMPTIELVDMAAELRGGNGSVFSRSLLGQVADAMQTGKQSIIFLNRRGFSSFIQCKNCGWSAKCEHCDVSLVYHKEDNMLKCHYCDSRFQAVDACPQCASRYLKFGATGTQKIVEELEKTFPTAQIFRMDADNVKNKEDLVNTIDEFAKTP